MKAPDKIYLQPSTIDNLSSQNIVYTKQLSDTSIAYLRKDALLEWLKSEMERLWELLPDSDNKNPTQMELRYLGQYMQMEALEDKLNSM